MRAISLQDLGALRQQLKDRAAQQAAQRAREEAERRRREREAAAFAHAVGPVTRLPDRNLHEGGGRPLPPPEPRQRELDEQAALKASLSDEVDLESLLLTDDGLSFRRPAIGLDVVTRLRKGHWSIQGELDLHGLRRDEARDALAHFIHQSHQHSRRCLRVVHGKGLGSPGREPVLKAKVQRWLAQREEVIAFTQATGPQGGAGALIVLLGSRPRGRVPVA
ncbi:DNA mismatch repair protein MutS [Ideonella sp. TBM-1]|uniref:DNA mismatch repair protein MutS n=1 Tax=Ideonella livida TaxID=2707176 RepID=A0A7C9TJ57_9BURK|nr:Smr/MutS family protein [Ideonella livida]NDY91518.1 DNA mismatch repair protein MutS [Ideonella livida]